MTLEEAWHCQDASLCRTREAGEAGPGAVRLLGCAGRKHVLLGSELNFECGVLSGQLQSLLDVIFSTAAGHAGPGLS